MNFNAEAAGVDFLTVNNPHRFNKYWSEDKADTFEIKNYKCKLKAEFLDEWDDLAYAIKRGRIQEVKEKIKKNKSVKGNVKFRPNGEGMLHACAEYGQPELFEWFAERYSAKLD